MTLQMVRLVSYPSRYLTGPHIGIANTEKTERCKCKATASDVMFVITKLKKINTFKYMHNSTYLCCTTLCSARCQNLVFNALPLVHYNLECTTVTQI